MTFSVALKLHDKKVQFGQRQMNVMTLRLYFLGMYAYFQYELLQPLASRSKTGSYILSNRTNHDNRLQQFLLIQSSHCFAFWGGVKSNELGSSVFIEHKC